MAEPASRFVIFAAPRTGSNWLCSLLDSHPEVLCHHEIFNPEGIFYSVSLRSGELDLGTVEERDRDPAAVLERLWQESFGRRWVGFKLNRDQDPRAFALVLADPGIRKILIKRRNRIRTFLSERVALATGEWESYPWSNVTDRKVRITVDPEALRAHVARNEQYFRGLEDRLRETDQPCLEVTYEALTDVDEQARILSFLDLELPPEGLRGATRKQGSRDLRDAIANFEPLARHLAGTELAAELLEPS
jgi:LPS sulfotransferase NodH